MSITIELPDAVVKAIHADSRGMDRVRALLCILFCQGQELDLLLDSTNQAIDKMIATNKRSSDDEHHTQP